MKFHDISPCLEASLAVFPGDQKFNRNVTVNFDQGNKFLLSSLLLSSHSGSHVDAPSHYLPTGISIDKIPLNIFFGMAQVIDCSTSSQRIMPSDFNGEFLCKKILLKTNSYFPKEWNYSFKYLDPSCLEFFSKKRVNLVGIDTPSVDSAHSKDLETHSEFYRKNITIVEGLNLQAINPGIYLFSGFPLKISGGEASPIRAVLIEGINLDES